MKTKILAILGICILLIAGGWGIPLYQEKTVMNKITKDAASFNAAVKEQPGILDNKTITRKRLHSTNPDRSDQVVLENITIRNLTFKESFFMQSIFRNVTFENCTFIKTNFNNSIFENVRFIDGKMYAYTEPKDSYAPFQTIIAGQVLGNILFDGVEFGKSVALDFAGVLIMRNCHSKLPPDRDSLALLGGNNMHVRMDNCQIFNQMALNVGSGNNTAYITNCEFKNAALRMSEGSESWLKNCRVSGVLPATETVVVKNSRISYAGVSHSTKGTKVFFVNNTFPEIPNTEDKTYLAIFGGTPEESAKSFFYFGAVLDN